MKSKGFTLIELMIIVAIIGILAAMAVPNLLKFQCISRGLELKIHKDLVEEVCAAHIDRDEKHEALKGIANGSRKAYMYLSDDALKELAGKGVDVDIPTKKTPKPEQENQCASQEVVIKELRLQINQLRQQPGTQKLEKEIKSWRN